MKHLTSKASVKLRFNKPYKRSMRALIQRVRSASVTIDNTIYSSIDEGFMVLLGIHQNDTVDVAHWMAHKIANLRLFPDADDKMNLSLLQTNGQILVVSQFTLYGDATKGFRPSFIESARPEIAEPLYELVINHLKTEYNLQVSTGVFGAMMDVALVNWGPVTILVEK